MDLPTLQPQEVDLAKVESQLESREAQLVDVRELNEANRLQHALVWPLSQLERMSPSQRQNLVQPYRDQILYLHCASGVRAAYCAALLGAHHSRLIPLKYSPYQLRSISKKEL